MPRSARQPLRPRQPPQSDEAREQVDKDRRQNSGERAGRQRGSMRCDDSAFVLERCDRCGDGIRSGLLLIEGGATYHLSGTGTPPCAKNAAVGCGRWCGDQARLAANAAAAYWLQAAAGRWDHRPRSVCVAAKERLSRRSAGVVLTPGLLWVPMSCSG